MTVGSEAEDKAEKQVDNVQKQQKQDSNLKLIIGLYRRTLNQCNTLINHIDKDVVIDMARLRAEEAKECVQKAMKVHDTIAAKYNIASSLYNHAAIRLNDPHVPNIDEHTDLDTLTKIEKSLAELTVEDASETVAPSALLTHSVDLHSQISVLQEKYKDAIERERALLQRIETIQDLENADVQMEKKQRQYQKAIATLKSEIQRLRQEQEKNDKNEDHNEIVRILSQKNHRLESLLEQSKERNEELQQLVHSQSNSPVLSEEEFEYARNVVGTLIKYYEAGDAKKIKQILPAVMASLQLDKS